MKTLICQHTMGLFISLTLFFAFNLPSSIAQQKIKVAGKMTAASTKQEVIAVGDSKSSGNPDPPGLLLPLPGIISIVRRIRDKIRFMLPTIEFLSELTGED